MREDPRAVGNICGVTEYRNGLQWICIDKKPIQNSHEHYMIKRWIHKEETVVSTENH